MTGIQKSKEEEADEVVDSAASTPSLALSDDGEPTDGEPTDVDDSNGPLSRGNHRSENSADVGELMDSDVVEGADEKVFGSTEEVTTLPPHYMSSSSSSANVQRRYSNRSEATKPDPPPSTVDGDEEREELDDLDDRGGRDAQMVEDENRIEGRILHAALMMTPPLETQGPVDAEASTAEEYVPTQLAVLPVEEEVGITARTLLPGSLPISSIENQQRLGIVRALTDESSVVINSTNEAGLVEADQNSAGTPVYTGEHLFIERVHHHTVGNTMNGGFNGPHDAVSPPTSTSLIRNPSFFIPPGSGIVRNSSFSQPSMQGPSFGHPLPESMVQMIVNGSGPPPPGGRRKIRLRMEEEPSLEGITDEGNSRSRPGLLRSIRRKFGSGEVLVPISESKQEHPKLIDRGVITLSWFEGTTSFELQEHVRRSVARKLKLPIHIQLTDFRVLDESTEPPYEEIVLSPFIPHGSEFLLRFSTRDMSKTTGVESPIESLAPDSPSAAPSPHHMNGRHGGLSSKELAHISKKLDALRPTDSDTKDRKRKLLLKGKTNGLAGGIGGETENQDGTNNQDDPDSKDGDNNLESNGAKSANEESSDDDEMVLHSEDPIEARLRQITELLLRDRDETSKKGEPGQNGRGQVIFVLANYFVLFLSLIALSAEIQARAPGWITMLEKEMKSVQNCAADQDALFECVSRGDFAGLIASCMLWLSRSAATRRVFLFGFETPKKLWTVVYESFVTAFCWGFSYLFIRRGLNPATRHRFLQKFWKDAVYGSLAGFNAAFMKQILKNLIPQEAVEDALRERHLKILSWLPTFS